MNIFVTGYKGKLGSQLIHMGCEPLDVDVSLKQIEIDIPDGSVIINCASKNAVDACESVETSYYWDAIDVNGHGVENLAKAHKGEIIHISTDYVFGGKRGAYSENYSKEDDLPTKRMSYGISKMLGEIMARNYNNVYIVRTTGLYGGISPKHDFLNFILDSYNIGVTPIKVTKELHSNQTYIPHLAEALIKYTEHKVKPKILHIASKEVIRRYEFALMIASVFDLDKSKLIPVRNSEVDGWVAERPKKAGLKTKLAQKLGLPIYSIIEGLEEAKKCQN